MGALALPHLAISLKQPWAWAVFNQCIGKDIENRTWWTAFRGPVWIASSAQVTQAYYDEASRIIFETTGYLPPHRETLLRGAILGRATIVDCILPGGYRVEPGTQCIRWPSGKGAPPEGARYHRLHPAKWHFHEQFGYVLEERKALREPVPCKGLQRFWRVPADVLEQLREAA